MSDKIFLGSQASDMDTGDIFQVTRVNLNVDSDNYYTAGNDTGQTIEVTCPWGTQAMADSILASLQGHQYQPYTASDALLDPAAEIGDAVTVGGVYSVIASIDTVFDRACAPAISAPASDEIDDEYPYESRERRETNRQLAQTRSLISKTSEEILLQVENELEGLSASFSVQLDSITSQITGLDGQVSTIQQTVSSITTQITGINGDISSLEQTATSLQTQIRNAQGDISSIEQYVDSITLSVTNGSDSSTIQLKAGSTTISSANITFNGMVTFNDLSTAGSTVINGANITTGTISADRINLTGSITWGDLDNSVQNDINDAISTAEDAYQIASGIELPSYIKDTYIDSTRIESPTIIAGEFYGNEFNVYPQSGSQGSFNLYGDTSQSSGFHMLEISYYWGDGAFVDFGSPAGAIARWEFGSTRFNGTTISFESGTDVSFNGAVDFSRANVTGLYMVFD